MWGGEELQSALYGRKWGYPAQIGVGVEGSVRGSGGNFAVPPPLPPPPEEGNQSFHVNMKGSRGIWVLEWEGEERKSLLQSSRRESVTIGRKSERLPCCMQRPTKYKRT